MSDNTAADERDTRTSEATAAFRDLWVSEDLASWIGRLSEDVVLRSPLFSATFRGRAEAAGLYEVLLAKLAKVTIVEAFESDTGSVVHWQAFAGRRQIEGLDVLRLDDKGAIDEIRVLIRPLVGLAAFSAAVGPALARKRGTMRQLITWILVTPLRGLFLAVDLIAPRLVKP